MADTGGEDRVALWFEILSTVKPVARTNPFLLQAVNSGPETDLAACQLVSLYGHCTVTWRSAIAFLGLLMYIC